MAEPNPRHEVIEPTNTTRSDDRHRHGIGDGPREFEANLAGSHRDPLR